MKDKGYLYDSRFLDKFKKECEIFNTYLLKAHQEGYKVIVSLKYKDFMDEERSALGALQIEAELWLDFMKEMK